MKRAADRIGGLALVGAILVSLGTAGVLAAGLYDGAYHGTLTADGANATNCAKQAPVQITVADNKLEYNHMGKATITATVGADGSFSGEQVFRKPVWTAGNHD